VSSSYLTAAYGESGAKWAAVTAGIAGAVLVVVAGGLWRRAKARRAAKSERAKSEKT
jgi:hypothetical protein